MHWRVYGAPKPKGSMRWVGNRMVNDNPDCAKWIEDVRIQLTGRQLHEGPVSVELRFYLPRGKTVKRNLPAVKPDLDKLVRAVLDALTGYCYKDDGQVVAVVANKEYADRGESGVAITLTPIQEGLWP